MSQTITVIGGGSWGTALCALLANNFAEVKLYSRNNSVVQSINNHHINTQYLPDTVLPDNIVAFNHLYDALDEHLNVLIVVPSRVFANSIQELAQSINQRGLNPDKISLIWGTKGLDPESNSLLSDVAQKQFPAYQKMGVVSGPSFAKETVKALPTALTIGSSDITQAEAFSYWFDTNHTRLYFTDDIIGVQLGGAVKNVIAIAAGISDGLGFGANARTAIITRGLSEMVRLGRTLNADSDTFMGLTGMGDLILTCTDNQSRNRRCGVAIGQGKELAQIKTEIGQEIEGIFTAQEIYTLATKYNVSMPISEKVYAILYENLSPRQAVKDLLSQRPRLENG